MPEFGGLDLSRASSGAALPTSARVQTPAKVNLFLGVHTELDERRYHRVDSVMAALSLCDEVVVQKADRLEVEMEPALDIPAEKSNVGKAVLRLAEALGVEPNVRVRVRRLVPMGGGLGGSSSDAGGTLRGLCALWGVDAGDERVRTVARSIGADVPFFLDPRPSYLAGGGDELVETYEPLPELPVVLVKPDAAVMTAAAYRDFDASPVEPGDLEAMRQALRAGDVEGVVAGLSNNLDPIACRLLAEEAEVKAWLQGCSGVRKVLVSGSGSCVFAVCSSAESVEEIAGSARAHGWWSCATKFAAAQPVEVC